MSRLSAVSGLLGNLLKKPATVREDYGFLAETYRAMPRRDEAKCTGCGACYERCSSGATKIIDEGDKRTIRVDGNNCIFCGRCADACPEHALSLTFEPESPEEKAAREEALKKIDLSGDTRQIVEASPESMARVNLAHYGGEPAPVTDTVLKLQRCVVCGEIMPATEKYLTVIHDRTLANLQPDTAKVIEKDMEKYLRACIDCRQKNSLIWHTHPRKWI